MLRAALAANNCDHSDVAACGWAALTGMFQQYQSHAQMFLRKSPGSGLLIKSRRKPGVILRIVSIQGNCLVFSILKSIAIVMSPSGGALKDPSYDPMLSSDAYLQPSYDSAGVNVAQEPCVNPSIISGTNFTTSSNPPVYDSYTSTDVHQQIDL